MSYYSNLLRFNIESYEGISVSFPHPLPTSTIDGQQPLSLSSPLELFYSISFTTSADATYPLRAASNTANEEPLEEDS